MARRRFPVPEILKILILIAVAIAIIATKDTCGRNVGTIFDTVAPPAPAADGGQIRR